jgi:hypothetical protein
MNDNLDSVSTFSDVLCTLEKMGFEKEEAIDLVLSGFGWAVGAMQAGRASTSRPNPCNLV